VSGMSVIWKFVLDVRPGGRCVLEVPEVREFFDAGEQDGRIVLWAAVDHAGGREEVSFTVVGTGWELPDGHYRGTVQMPDGLVWHVFEQGRG
jgi:hypothetical protein